MLEFTNDKSDESEDQVFDETMEHLYQLINPLNALTI